MGRGRELPKKDHYNNKTMQNISKVEGRRYAEKEEKATSEHFQA